MRRVRCKTRFEPTKKQQSKWGRNKENNIVQVARAWQRFFIWQLVEHVTIKRYSTVDAPVHKYSYSASYRRHHRVTGARKDDSSEEKSPDHTPRTKRNVKFNSSSWRKISFPTRRANRVEVGRVGEVGGVLCLLPPTRPMVVQAATRPHLTYVPVTSSRCAAGLQELPVI